MAGIGDGSPGQPDASVADMLKNLHLTAEEEEVVAFSDEEEEDPKVEWVLVGKVLSPTTVHATAIKGAMKPAWGNPAGLKIRSIGTKGDNLFIAEFNYKQDMERALGGSPWLVGKHAVILRDYDESLKPSEIRFDRMDIWVRILDLPLGWMNKHRGERAMGLIGEVRRMDVDRDGKASGPYLRARVAIEISKPVRRGVLLKTKRDGAADWFDIQYEKLPFYCLSCGVMGHSQLECDKPLVRNAEGKLPYDGPLRVSDPKRKKVQSFSEAAAEAFVSGSSSTSRQSQGKMTRTEDRRSAEQRDGMDGEEGEEVNSPPSKARPVMRKDDELANKPASRQLFNGREEGMRKVQRKRKSKNSSPNSSQTPDLNIPMTENLAVVPTGLVSSMVSQLDGGNGSGTCTTAASDELTKKQKRNYTQSDARSAAAARDSPRRAQ